MKAFVYKKYGNPEQVLALLEVDIPEPGEKQVLIKIKATTINDYDWSVVRGKPYIYRLIFGAFRPKNQIPGMELSGIIEKTGSAANKFRAGDAVYGDTSGYGFGTFAEYICINEDAVVKKPDDISFEAAAALPHASLLAFQALEDLGKIKENQKILINGAGGGVGTIAIGLAKRYNCNVTGVDSGDKLNLLKELHFDHVIDYRKDDFTRDGRQYDLILDCKSNKTAFSYLRALKPKGKYVTVGGKPGNLIGLLMMSLFLPLFTKKKIRILALKPNRGLKEVEECHKKGQIKSIIDGPYKLKDIPRLISYFGEGRHKGKVVITLGND